MKVSFCLRETPRTTVQDFKIAVSAAHILYYLDLKSHTTTLQCRQLLAVTSLIPNTPMLNVNVHRHLDDACCYPSLLKHRRAGSPRRHLVPMKGVGEG